MSLIQAFIFSSELCKHFLMSPSTFSFASFQIVLHTAAMILIHISDDVSPLLKTQWLPVALRTIATFLFMT